MRHVHAGYDPRHRASFRQVSSAHHGTNPRRLEWQSMPLHGLHAYLRSRREGCDTGNFPMRSNPAEYEFISPGNLAGALDLLHREPGVWQPVAGGTEIMVQYSSGLLGARRLLNLWNLKELKEIVESKDSLRIGGGCTFTQLREHSAVRNHFPLLVTA